MGTELSGFIKRVEGTRKKLNSVKARQVQSDVFRNEMRKIVEDYFNTIRPSIISDEEINPQIGIIDGEMQSLIEQCHKKGTTLGYKKLLSQIRNSLIIIDTQLIAFPLGTTNSKNPNSLDQQIIGTLEKILPSAALSYKQAIMDLQTDYRFSWRGPATDLRESVRETLDHLAPDVDVVGMTGYKQLKDTNGPTMKQKVRYILMKRGITKTQSETSENATESIEEGLGKFVRSVYTRSSISTHTPTEKDEVIRIRNFVRATLCELLEIKN